MVTWTFDLFALFIGFVIGVVVGMLLFCFIELRDGGSWSKGFMDGCKMERFLENITKDKE